MSQKNYETTDIEEMLIAQIFPIFLEDSMHIAEISLIFRIS